MQTETPYFQANPDASQPYQAGVMTSDPTFDDCSLGSYCEEAFALRVIRSSNILIYSAGFYSFFQDYAQTCLDDESCQEKLIETSFSQGLWFYNIFTKGAVQVVSPDGGIPPTLQSDNQK
jgi:glucan 1,3-beta-glucosidase